MAKMKIAAPLGCWVIGTRVRKKYVSSWRGRIVGYYSTENTPVGYLVETERRPGSVKPYPAWSIEFAGEEDVDAQAARRS